MQRAFGGLLYGNHLIQFRSKGTCRTQVVLYATDRPYLLDMV